MKYIDLHCDTLMRAYIDKREDLIDYPEASIDLRRMKQGGTMAQFFAIFMLPEGCEIHGKPLKGKEYYTKCREIFYQTMQKCPDEIAPAYCADDLRHNETEGKISGILTFEDGRLIDGKLENLDYYYSQGIRLISLTWNFANCFGYPNSTDPEVMRKGLTDFGKDAVRRMNEIGMIVDVSHLSDGGFWDVAEISNKPFVASHSNVRSLCPHLRNLTPEMIRKLADKGGVIGLNYMPDFLQEDLNNREDDLEVMSRHIRELIRLGGIGCAALGSDFDGFQEETRVCTAADIPLLFDRLHQDGLTDDEIEKVAWKNVVRVLHDTIG